MLPGAVVLALSPARIQDGEVPMRLRPDDVLKFDQVLPMFNWFYPLANQELDPVCSAAILSSPPPLRANLRALYVHIPFCESICTFCPFTRSAKQSDEAVDVYVDGLIREIEMKARYPEVASVPVEAIFFGGGSPSILTGEHFRRIGAALRASFDLSALREFSVEMSLRDLTEDKIQAMREVGVSHARFGVQTFNEEYRRHFGLTTPLDLVYENVTILQDLFPFVSFDMLYGMDGQTEGEFVEDLEKAVRVGTRNIAFYPINNLVTQPSLHRSLQESGRRPLSGATRFYMNILLRKFMEASGFLPHNGHEYVAVDDSELRASPVTTRTYTFLYHRNLYGCSDREVLGFGLNAMSVTNGYVFQNTSSLPIFIKAVQGGRLPIAYIGQHDETTYQSRGVILHLPYHGYLGREQVTWEAVHPETLCALDEVVKAGLVQETTGGYELTREGWYWYVSLMYYLSPRQEQSQIDRFIMECSLDRSQTVDLGYVAL